MIRTIVCRLYEDEYRELVTKIWKPIVCVTTSNSDRCMFDILVVYLHIQFTRYYLRRNNLLTPWIAKRFVKNDEISIVVFQLSKRVKRIPRYILFLSFVHIWYWFIEVKYLNCGVKPRLKCVILAVFYPYSGFCSNKEDGLYIFARPRF